MDHQQENESLTSSSVSLNQVMEEDQVEAEGIALLRQIFPEESTDALRRLHLGRITRYKEDEQLMHNASPPSVISSIINTSSNDIVAQLEARIVEECDGPVYSRLIRRDQSIGLGLTLYEFDNRVRVHSLSSIDGRHFTIADSYIFQEESARGPAIQAGIRVGDHLLGINGSTLAEAALVSDLSLLHYAVVTIRESPDPIVLHLRRNTDPSPLVGVLTPPRELRCESTQALLDATNLDESFLPDDNDEASYSNQRLYQSTPMTNMKMGGIHALAAVLAQRGILKSTEEQLSMSRMLLQLDERAREWETTSSFNLKDGFIPLLGIRQSLTVRILNSFVDGNTTAYAVWVYDVDSGTEWYAPLRYWEDFVELRATVIQLEPATSKIQFPKLTRSFFGSPLRNEKEGEREKKCSILEAFLRAMCRTIHCAPLHAATGEVAVLVQSFLGCDAVLANPSLQKSQYESTTFSAPLNLEGRNSVSVTARRRLKQNLQKYTHRLLLLTPMQNMVEQFVESIRSRRPNLDDRERMEALEAEGRHVLKQKALEDLQHVQAFLDYLQELLLEACKSEYRSIAERDEYDMFQEILKVEQDEVVWNSLMREAIREQVEIEVYVPLRSVVSRWLVTGWKHEDMECHFKMKELRKRSLHYFRVDDSVDPMAWESVANILRRGVGQSTLPSAKLRATVDAAREISTLFQRNNDQKKDAMLGADDFLPIFIYCVVKANVERPCALCVLLRSLCDSVNRMGEIGYYLASFEAAIAHIQEVDLSEENEEMLSFLSIPLDN